MKREFKAINHFITPYQRQILLDTKTPIDLTNLWGVELGDILQLYDYGLLESKGHNLCVVSDFGVEFTKFIK